MPYYNPLNMSQADKDKFRAWFEAEELGLEPLDVSVEGFSVHNGWVAGKQILRKPDGSAVVFNYSVVLVPFRRKQRNPLPAFDYESNASPNGVR